MKARPVLAALLVLAGCDEPTVISNVDRRPHMTSDQLWTIQDARGIPVEIHGRPFRRVSDRELAEALRPPGGASQEVRFYAAPPGSWVRGHPWRLVLYFNPQGGPNAYADCQRVEEARSNPAPEGGFTVNASFCNGAEWQAHGYLQALKIDDGDLGTYADMMAQLMQAIFREEKDR